MSKDDPFRFNLRFDSTDEDHREVAAFLNSCGRKKARYIVKAFQAYWGKSETKNMEWVQKNQIADTTEQQEEVKEHFVNIETEELSADQAEISLMMKNYQMFDSLGEEN